MYNFTTNRPYCETIIYKLTVPVTYVNQGFSFLCMLTGNAALRLNDQVFHLTDKDVILLEPEQYYHLESEATALILELSFEYLFFKDAFSENYKRILCNSFLDTNHAYSTLRTYLAQIALVHYSDIIENRFYLLSNVFHLFHYISSEFIIPVSETENNLNKQQKKLNKIITYIQKNYFRSITLQDLANEMDFTPQYLVKFMKQYLNQTFYEFVNHIRLLAAIDQLKYTDKSIAAIASSCGFPNLPAFQKTFHRSFGIDPTNYRKDLSLLVLPSDSKENSMITEPSLAKDYITNNIRITGYSNSIIESSSAETIIVNASKHKPLVSSWKELINLGFSFNFEKPSFRAHLAELQSELKFKYGRIQGILELIDIYSSDNTTTYTLIKVFRIIDFLRSIQMLPLFELGNKSYSIYKETVHELPSQQSGSDYQQMVEQLLPVLLKNCINRYGFQEVSLWKFELWMEYNTVMTVCETPASYVNRFQFVYETVKSFVPSAKVGGPGFNTFMNISYLEDVLKELLKKHLVPDFISFYLYPYIHPGGSGLTEAGDLQVLLSKDKNIYKRYVDQITLFVHKHFRKQAELYVTEYSSFISSHNYINDSTYQAAFIVKETMDNFAFLQTLGYWLLSDISITYDDAADILFGGNGLVSRDGIKKPSYYAFHFLESLGNHLISKGNHYIVTSNSSRSFQILVYHYGYFNEEYCENQKKFELLRYPSSVFEHLPPLDLTIQLTEIPSGTYIIRQHTLDQGHGSILYEWMRMDTPKDLNNQEINYLKHISVPEIKLYKKEVTDLLEVTCHLNLNDVVLFEIDLYL